MGISIHALHIYIIVNNHISHCVNCSNLWLLWCNEISKTIKKTLSTCPTDRNLHQTDNHLIDFIRLSQAARGELKSVHRFRSLDVMEHDHLKMFPV